MRQQQQQQQRVRAAAVFISLSCSVFLCCDISTVTVLIRGSRELPSCFVVWAICVLHSKRTCVFDHALHFCLRLTRGSGAVLAAMERVSSVLYFFEWYKCRPLVKDHRVEKRRRRRRLVATISNTQWVSSRDCWED